MQVKFNKYERLAGIFVVAAVVGAMAFLVSVADRQGWFDKKVYFETTFENADGVHPGTMVQMAGLHAGAVEQVDLIAQDKILVRFYVLSKFRDKVRKDSQASLTRPFLIGERILDVTVGARETGILLENSVMVSREAVDLMSALSGKKLGAYMDSMGEMMSNLRYLAESFLSKDRTESLVRAMDKVEPLLKNMNAMSVEMIKISHSLTKDDDLGVVVSEMAKATKELNHILPLLSEHAPELAKTTDSLIHNMAILTEEFKTLIPALREIAPELPAASRRALEALDEAVVLMKAMQRSFFVKSSADEVRKEEKDEVRKGRRMPANVPPKAEKPKTEDAPAGDSTKD